MSERPGPPTDIELMEHADGETDGDPRDAERIEQDPDAVAKVQALKQLGELVRGHLELTADALHDANLAAMWRRIDDQLESRPVGLWARVTAWFDHHRGHIITGAVSASAVAALALVLRPGTPEGGFTARRGGVIDVRPVAMRASPEIDALDTPGASSTVISLDDDEDGHTTVIWVTPDEPLEGI